MVTSLLQGRSTSAHNLKLLSEGNADHFPQLVDAVLQPATHPITSPTFVPPVRPAYCHPQSPSHQSKLHPRPLDPKPSAASPLAANPSIAFYKLHGTCHQQKLKHQRCGAGPGPGPSKQLSHLTLTSRTTRPCTCCRYQSYITRLFIRFLDTQ